MKTAIKTQTDYAQFNVLMPYKDTAIYNEGVEKGVLPANFWSGYVRDPRPNTLVPMWDEHLSREELSALAPVLFRRFYLRPGKVLRHLIRVRSWKHLKSQVKGALTIMGYRRKETQDNEIAGISLHHTPRSLEAATRALR